MKGFSKGKMATAKKKIERAYTAKDIESDDLECAMINMLNMDINSIDENDMSNYIEGKGGWIGEHFLQTLSFSKCRN